MGEAYGIYDFGDDRELMSHVTLANVACGFHGGDPTVMQRTVQLGRRARRGGRRAPLLPGPAGLWPAGDGHGPRGARGGADLPGGRAEGLPRRGRDGAVASEAARRPVWRRGARPHRGRRRGGRRGRVRGAGAGDRRHAARDGLHRARAGVLGGVLRRPGLRRRGRADHHAYARRVRSGAGGGARRARAGRGRRGLRVREGVPDARGHGLRALGHTGRGGTGGGGGGGARWRGTRC